MSISVLIIGAGPAGCYVVEQLLKKDPNISIDILEKNPYPFGLLRTGVAPDHQKIKGLQRYFEKILANQNVSLFTNVEFGTDIKYQEVKDIYDGIFICTGSATDNLHDKLDYSHHLNCGSLQVVNWYNGTYYNPKKFNPQHLNSSIAIIGLGNVALDIARIFLKPTSKLQSTEIPNQVLDLLNQKHISDVHIFVRRGPAQAKCSPKELEEVLELENASCTLHDFKVSSVDLEEAESTNRIKKNLELFKSISAGTQNKQALHIHFYSKLDKCIYDSDKLTLRFNKTKLAGSPNQQKLIETTDSYELCTNFLISSIGYRGTPLSEIPFNDNTHKIKHTLGHVQDNIFTAGWIKRGPTGVIGTNKRDALESVTSFFNYLESNPTIKKGKNTIQHLLQSKSITFFTYQDWTQLDDIEIQQGIKTNKSRVKISDKQKIKSLLHK